MELVGVQPTCLLTKTQSSFEEAHHWNIQAKFYSVKVPTQLCMNDMKTLYEVQVLLRSTSVDLKKKNSSVAPSLFLFLFLWPLWLFLLYLSFVLFGIFSFCPLWDRLICPLWDLFLTIRATLYIKMNMINTLLQGTHNETGTIS